MMEHLPSPRSHLAMTLALVFALVPPALAVARENPGWFGIQLATALATLLAWELGFARLRGRCPGMAGIASALIVTILVPRGLPLWQLILMLSLGTLLAEQVFGGRGFGFLNVATVTLALLLFSFPQVEQIAPSRSLALASLAGMALLLALGLISGRVIVGTAIGTLALLAIGGRQIDPVATATAVTFGLVFLIADPMAAAATNAGRLIYGILAGALIVILSGGAAISTQAVIFAALLASVFAPLIDQIVARAHARRRQARRA